MTLRQLHTYETTGPEIFMDDASGLIQVGATAAASNLSAGVQDTQAIASVDGAILVKTGSVIITKASIANLTLAAPTAGAPANGGDDGKLLTVISTTAFAHVITTPTNGINGTLHLATFAAAAGNQITLEAYNGSWWNHGGTGVTIS